MTKSMEGKIAAITGAASGIGLATSRALLDAGAKVVMVDYNAAALDRLTAELGPNAIAQVTNLLDAQSCSAMVPEILAKVSHIDILHCNAGTYIGGDLIETDTDTIDRMLSLAEPPTVLCCGNDQMAMMVYGILRSMGRKVPEEISVAGYDNYRAIAETLFPPLTTVELSYNAMGVRAGERLLAMISGAGRDDRTPTLVAGPVQWRGSVTELRGATILQLKSVRED